LEMARSSVPYAAQVGRDRRARRVFSARAVPRSAPTNSRANSQRGGGGSAQDAPKTWRPFLPHPRLYLRRVLGHPSSQVMANPVNDTPTTGGDQAGKRQAESAKHAQQTTLSF